MTNQFTVGPIDDQVLCTAWGEEVARIARNFSIAPEAWEDGESTAFKERCAAVFGIEDDRCADIIQAFHEQPYASRMGVQVKLMRSSLFGYVKRVIGEMDPDEDIEVEAPDSAFRNLLKCLLNSE